MKNRLNKSLKLFALPLLVATTLNAATYDETYRVTDLNKSIEKNDNQFMDGTFQEIIRYDMIWFDGDEIDEDSKPILDEAIEKIKEYVEASKIVKVTVIGHTNRATDDKNELSIDSDTYANGIQNWFRYSMDTNESLDMSKAFANTVEDVMVDAGIDNKILFVEYRGGVDTAYTEATTEGRDLSNRVMITIYVNKPVDIDSDKDGVFDRFDRCPATPRGSKVDKNGCPIDSDKDGVLDYKDKCPNTPKGVMVDTKGCPLDSDGDGVVDYKDKCPDTPKGLIVDPNGCPVKSTLKLNFKPNSDKILKESHPEVQRFAKFLKKNPAYSAEIIGHTDSIGKAVVNMKLSQRRAAMTKKALVAEGIDASRLTTRGRGELDPIESNMYKAGRKVNRRIEVKLSFKKK